MEVVEIEDIYPRMFFYQGLAMLLVLCIYQSLESTARDSVLLRQRNIVSTTLLGLPKGNFDR
jgi:hypothetical protein